MMIKSGYSAVYAGAVEAVASTGGQILPPVMGVAAFLMAEITGIPYLEIIKRAAFPAILYFLIVYMMIHFNACKKETKGHLNTLTLISTRKILFEKGHLLLPVFVILYLLFIGYTPQYACFYGIMSVIFSSSIRKNTRPKLINIYNALIKGAKMVVPVAAACAGAGIVIGIVSLSGLGFRMTQLVIKLSGGNLFIALLLAMVTAIILGMGLPTSAAYIIMATLLAPALVKMGIPLIAAHLFVLYYSCLSAITPPIALAAYAASGIAKTSPMSTGFMAWRIGLSAFIVPFVFVYSPSLLIMGDFKKIMISIFTGILTVIFISAANEGWFYKNLSLFFRFALFISGILIIIPNNIIVNIFGLSIGTYIFLKNKYNLGRN